mmetsp:Transcript_75391/g.140630  ORF Transcript_75391/g.140630 Transcript_75391/m.140630 type:complete len:240 (+) Transcript_75391:48-767(+)
MGCDGYFHVEVFRAQKGPSGERLVLSPCWRAASRLLQVRRFAGRESSGRPSALGLLPISMMVGSLFGASVRAKNLVKNFKRWQSVDQWPCARRGALSKMREGWRNREFFWMLCGYYHHMWFDLSSARPIFADCGPGGQKGWPDDLSDLGRQNLEENSHEHSHACYTVEALASFDWDQPLTERTNDIDEFPEEDRDHTCRQFVDQDDNYVDGIEEELSALATLAPYGNPQHVRLLFSLWA